MFRRLSCFTPLAFLLIASCMSSDEMLEQLPPKIKAAVIREFPNADILEIEQEDWRGQEVFEVEFIRDNMEVEAFFSLDGVLLDMEEQSIGKVQLPPFQGGILEKDVRIPMRDNSYLVADVFRPKGSEPCPAIVTIGPHGKDRLPWRPGRREGVVEVSPYTAYETPDPEWWCPRGYAHVRIDQRGLGKSPGAVSALTRQEAEDYYDAIQWAGTQKWCNGKVGLLGISIYAVNQWNVAGLRPPHLAAMIPWEGFTDLYRDFAYHGGVPADNFIEAWYQQRILGNVNDQTKEVVNLPELLQNNPFDNEVYSRLRPDLERIDVPLFAVANWGSHGLHLRGMFEGFRRAGSKHKWLRVHGNPKLGDYYGEEGRFLQKEFFDYWLKGIKNSVMEWPRIQIAVRHENRNLWRDEERWPLTDTWWTPYYLDAAGRLLKNEQAEYSGKASWDGEKGGVCFTTPPFKETVEITGPLAANLWVSSTEQDVDLFVAIRNLRPDGTEVLMLGEEGLGPVTLGWLRVSHRELDVEKSTPYQPYHTHQVRKLLSPGQIVPINIEIWPTSMVFNKGNRLQLEIRCNDPEGLGDILHHHPLEKGRHTIHTGEEHNSHLLLPIVKGR